MASETIKALVMMSLFCGFEAALHLSQLKQRNGTAFAHIRRWRSNLHTLLK